jgi:hypothetical protein
MAKRWRGDPTFLRSAALAAVCGFGCIGAGIGMPVWSWMHGGHASPAFFYFSLWGFVALMGAAANIYVYFQTMPPPQPPPRGGNRDTVVTSLDARRRPEARLEDRAKAA